MADFTKRTALAALILGFGVSLSSMAPPDAACLHYGPERVVLSGTMKRLTFPGPPGYKSIAEGDARETGYYLALASPICVDGDVKDDTAYPQEDISLVQLAHTVKDEPALKRLVGRSARLSGALFAAHTMHHHAPIILTEVVIDAPR